MNKNDDPLNLKKRLPQPSSSRSYKPLVLSCKRYSEGSYYTNHTNKEKRIISQTRRADWYNSKRMAKKTTARRL